jgi:hypothetical protein
MKAAFLLGAVLSLAALPAAAQTALPAPGTLGAGQVGTGAIVLPRLPITSAATPLMVPAPGVTLTSANPAGSANPDAATGATTTGAIGGGASSGGTVSGGGGSGGGVSDNGGGPAARAGTGSTTNNATPAAGAGRTDSAVGGTAGASSGSATGVARNSGDNASSAGAGGAGTATTNNATAAANPGRGAETVLCLPADASTTQPFLDGTGLSCAP